jgi:uncharacterized protein (DUF2384 family)
MGAIDVLIQEFPGEDQWLEYVEVFRKVSNTLSDQSRLVGEVGNEEIAIVLNARMGQDAYTWIKQPIGALDNRSVQDVLSSHPYGEIAVKGLIMRTPI